MILISEDDKKNFKTFFENPDPQPALRRKKQPKEPLVLEKPKTLPPKRVRPSLNYGDINDEAFDEDDYQIQPENPTNDIKKPNLKIHIESDHKRIKLFKCKKCDFETAQKPNLKTHIESVHEKTFKCNICDHDCANDYHLKKHITNCHGFSISNADLLSVNKLDPKKHIEFVHK